MDGELDTIRLPAPALELNEGEEVYYRESDGSGLGESGPNTMETKNAIDALSAWFLADEDVEVNGRMFFYPVEGNHKICFAPDVYFVRGHRQVNPLRRTFKVWEEGKAPDLVIEFTSKDTWDEDLFRKRMLYQDLGVQEYILFDPMGDWIPEQLRMFRLQDKVYQQLGPDGGPFLSEVLGLGVLKQGSRLRFREPDSDRLLPSGAHEGRQQGREEGLEQGREEGREQGLVTAIRTVLEARFGPVPAEMLSRLAGHFAPDVAESLVKQAALALSLDAFAAHLAE